MSATPSNDLRPWRLAPFTSSVIFYLFFALVFLLSGALTAIRVIPYRMGLVSFLVLPVIPLYRFKLDNVTKAFLLLVLAIGASAAVNGSTLVDLIVFLRIPTFAFLTYFLADRYLNRANAQRVFRLLLFLGYLQLPVVLAQLATGWLFPDVIQGRVSQLDFDFGTFNWSGDSSMALFLILLATALLFSTKVRSLARRPAFTASYFSLTVLMSNSRIAHLALLLVWLVYVGRVVWRREARASGTFVLAFAAFLAMMCFVDVHLGKSLSALNSNVGAIGTGQTHGGVEEYLSGGYSRGGALRYFWSQGISWFGDGPSAYYNPITRVRTRGNHGHFFTFYSEVGLIGWGMSVLVFLLMVFKRSKDRVFGLSLVGLLLFVVIQVMGFTLEIMNDISAVFAYVLISRYYLLPNVERYAGDAEGASQVDSLRSDDTANASLARSR